MPLVRKKEILTGYYLGLRSYHVHVLSKHGITSCIYESNNIRIVVGFVLNFIYFNKENGTDSDNLTIRTRKTDMMKKNTKNNF